MWRWVPIDFAWISVIACYFLYRGEVFGTIFFVVEIIIDVRVLLGIKIDY